MPGLGLGLGVANEKRKLENGNRKREVAWHLSATVNMFMRSVGSSIYSLGVTKIFSL